LITDRENYIGDGNTVKGAPSTLICPVPAGTNFLRKLSDMTLQIQ